MWWGGGQGDGGEGADAGINWNITTTKLKK